jgi:hypothetical protein
MRHGGPGGGHACGAPSGTHIANFSYARSAGSRKKKGKEGWALPGPTADAVGYFLTPLRGYGAASG